VVHHVPSAIEDFADVQLQPGIFEDPHWAAVVKFHQHINVARLRGIAARDQTEHCGMRDAEPMQFPLVAAERFEYTVRAW